MLDIPIKIPKEYYKLLEGFLTEGKAVHEKFSLDFSEVQTIKTSKGKLTFNPPVKVSANLGPISLKTTITTIKAESKGVVINIDNSPVDVEIAANE